MGWRGQVGKNDTWATTVLTVMTTWTTRTTRWEWQEFGLTVSNSRLNWHNSSAESAQNLYPTWGWKCWRLCGRRDDDDDGNQTTMTRWRGWRKFWLTVPNLRLRSAMTTRRCGRDDKNSGSKVPEIRRKCVDSLYPTVGHRVARNSAKVRPKRSRIWQKWLTFKSTWKWSKLSLFKH